MTETSGRYFELFTEIGIIAQLTRTLMESRLPEGLTAPHFNVVNHLYRMGDGATPRDLARAFQVPKNSMTNTLSGLEKHGLIETRPNPQDGRSRYVALTPAGRDFRARAIEALIPDIAELARHIPPDNVEAVLPALTEIRRVLDESRTAKPAAGSSAS